MPLEQGAQEYAIQTSAFTTLLLTRHGEVAFPLSAGIDVIRLAQEVAHHAAESRAKLGQLHEALRPIAAELDPKMWSGADCPPNTGALMPELRSVA